MEKEIWVECIDDFSLYGKILTVGKMYKVKEVPSDNNCYLLQNDDGIESYYSKIQFKPVDKTSILKTIKWNGVDNLRQLIEDSNVEIDIQVFHDYVIFYLHDFNKTPIWHTHILQVNKVECFIENFTYEINTILKQHNIKLEIEQLKYKINCDKLYTKQEADRLKESGIDLVEIK